MTKKIGVSLRQELYDWAAREVEEGRAESVSALIAQGLELLEARAQLEAVVTALSIDFVGFAELDLDLSCSATVLTPMSCES